MLKLLQCINNDDPMAHWTEHMASNWHLVRIIKIIENCIVYIYKILPPYFPFISSIDFIIFNKRYPIGAGFPQ